VQPVWPHGYKISINLLTYLLILHSQFPNFSWSFWYHRPHLVTRNIYFSCFKNTKTLTRYKKTSRSKNIHKSVITGSDPGSLLAGHRATYTRKCQQSDRSTEPSWGDGYCAIANREIDAPGYSYKLVKMLSVCLKNVELSKLLGVFSTDRLNSWTIMPWLNRGYMWNEIISNLFQPLSTSVSHNFIPTRWKLA